MGVGEGESERPVEVCNISVMEKNRTIGAKEWLEVVEVGEGVMLGEVGVARVGKGAIKDGTQFGRVGLGADEEAASSGERGGGDTV